MRLNHNTFAIALAALCLVALAYGLESGAAKVAGTQVTVYSKLLRLMLWIVVCFAFQRLVAGTQLRVSKLIFEQFHIAPAVYMGGFFLGAALVLM